MGQARTLATGTRVRVVAAKGETRFCVEQSSASGRTKDSTKQEFERLSPEEQNELRQQMAAEGSAARASKRYDKAVAKSALRDGSACSDDQVALQGQRGKAVCLFVRDLRMSGVHD